MAIHHPNRAAPADHPEPGASDLPLDHALSLLLADETENALRWGAAVLESGPWTPSALVVTARLLDQMGRRRAAIEGLNLAVQQSIAEGNLPLAMAAAGDLRSLGADVTEPLDRIAAAFCEGSDRLRGAQEAPLLPQFGDFRPLSPFLTGPALASKAAQIVEAVRRTEHEDADEAPSRIAPLPLFSALAKEPLHDLLAAFDTVTVPAGHAVIREGEEEAAAYIVARGELEVSRRSSDDSGKPLVLARLGSGAFFGEMALLSQLPGAASVVATRPSILLVARRDALEAVVEKHPEVAVELAAHCRRQSVANLGWASPVVVAIPPRERAALVERFETRMFEAGDKLVEAGEEALGLHLIVSGEIGVIAHEGGERVVLATLTAGETVGEVELVLCRDSVADAVAVRPTATLFLPRDEFFAIVQDHPAILHGLYGIAVRRHAETSLALAAGSAETADEPLLAHVEHVPDELAALVESEPALSEVERGDPQFQRIMPLARGTLALPRVSPPPPRASTIPPPLPRPPAAPRSPFPAPAKSPPSSRTPPRGTSAQPFAVSSRSPEVSTRSNRPVDPSPRSNRRTEALPNSNRPAETTPQSHRSVESSLPSSRPSSMAPITSAAGVGGGAERRSWPHSRALAGMGFAAIAAGAVAFVTARGLAERGPVATPAAAPSALATTAPVSTLAPPPSPAPSTAWTAIPPNAQPPVAAKPKHHAPPAVAKSRADVAPPSVSVANVSPAASSAPVVSSSAPPASASPQPNRPQYPAAKSTGPDQALSASEFGGRE